MARIFREDFRAVCPARRRWRGEVTSRQKRLRAPEVWPWSAAGGRRVRFGRGGGRFDPRASRRLCRTLGLPESRKSTAKRIVFVRRRSRGPVRPDPAAGFFSRSPRRKNLSLAGVEIRSRVACSVPARVGRCRKISSDKEMAVSSPHLAKAPGPRGIECSAIVSPLPPTCLASPLRAAPPVRRVPPCARPSFPPTRPPTPKPRRYAGPSLLAQLGDMPPPLRPQPSRLRVWARPSRGASLPRRWRGCGWNSLAVRSLACASGVALGVKIGGVLRGVLPRSFGRLRRLRPAGFGWGRARLPSLSPAGL